MYLIQQVQKNDLNDPGLIYERMSGEEKQN